MDNIFPIKAIDDPAKIRVLLYSNQRMVHVPLLSLLSPIEKRLEFLENHIKKLEGK